MLRSFSFCLALALCAGTVVSAWAEDSSQAITNIEAAGPEFEVQGEYLGEFNLGDGIAQKFGLQVIALGDGKYRGVAFFGGLPGDGWDGFGKLETESEDREGVITLVANEGYATIIDGEVTVKSIDEQELGALKKISRESPTLGVEPPEGAIVLFDGQSADGWEKGSLSDDGFLQGGTKSKQKFQDFTLHLEFRTPYMPSKRGQARGNSGVYLQGCYEVQILDSFGLEGLDNECGGIYSKKAPRENMCLPPLSWQTYDIDFTAAKFDDDGNKTANAKLTVRHNGEIIHENYELPEETPGGQKEDAEPGPIMLQDHGDPVVFRNIWVIER